MSETTGRTTDGTMLIRGRRVEYQWLRDADGEQLYGFIVSQADIAAIEQAAVRAALEELRKAVEARRPSKKGGWNAMAGEAYAIDVVLRLIDERLAR